MSLYEHSFKGQDFKKTISDLLFLPLEDDKEYTISIAQSKRKRSLDANAYCWVLIGKLAQKLNLSDLEVYRHFIQDTSAYEVMPIRNDAVDRFIDIWESNGKGWIVHSLGDSKIPNYTNLQCYYGSSVYDMVEMNRLISLVADACHEQGIETATPEEIAMMISLGAA